MMTRTLIIGAHLILCALLFFACTEDEIALDYSKAIHIKVNGKAGSTDQYSASSLFDSIGLQFIRMDRSTQLAAIDKVFFAGDNVIVVDQRVARRILAFSRTGDLQFEILNVNKTAFPDLGDVIYIQEKNLLEVHDAGKDKILSYDARTGELVKERPSKLRFFSFCYLGSNSYAYYTHFADKLGGKIKHNLIIEDSLGNLKQYLPYYHDEVRTADVPLNYRPFFGRGGKQYLAPYCSKYVYEITPGGVTPVVQLDLGGPSVDVYGGLVKRADLKKIDSTPLFAGNMYMGKDNNLYFTYLHNKTMHACLHLAQKQVDGIETILNDLTDVPLQTNFIAQTDSFIVQALDLEEVNAAAEQFKYEAKDFSARMKALVNKYPPGSFLIQKLYFRL